MYVSYSAYVGEFHHLSILGGVERKSVVAEAGEIEVRNGVLKSIDNEAGTSIPTRIPWTKPHTN